MATLSLTVLPAKVLKDGKHKVRIAVAHNSSTRYILTDVVLDNINEWRNGRVVKRGDAAYLNQKLQQHMAKVQQEIDAVQYKEGLSCAELIEAMKQAKADKNRSMRSVFDELIEVSTAKDSTKRTYAVYFKLITRTIPDATLVRNITPLMVRKFVANATKQVSSGTLCSAMTFLGTLLLYCQRNGYTEFITMPTSGVPRPRPPIRQNWLTPDQVRQIRDMDDCTPGDIRFKDIFMLSYYLGGINLIDLSKINFGECGTHLKYVRSKTERIEKANRYVEFEIPGVAMPIIERNLKPDGHINLWNASKEDLCVNIAQYCRNFRTRHSMKEDMTYYSARKSFAQHAFNLGISESVIDYILGHSLGTNKSCLYSYIKVTPAMATEAVQKVCDFIAGSENFD